MSRGKNITSEVAGFWDDVAINKSQFISNLWTSHPLVKLRINQLISGDANTDPWQYMLRFLDEQGVVFPVASLASLGCGTGELERGLSKYGTAMKYTGLDISPASIRGAIEESQAMAGAEFKYAVADLNKPQLEPREFDVIICNGSVHHIENLEALAESIELSLVPGGWLVLDEFVGPKRFQWTDRQLDLINRALKTLPEEFRTDRSGNVKQAVFRETIEHMIDVDPSEAVRSDEIMGIFAKRFNLALAYRELSNAMVLLCP